jgi:tRNA threonylcarbamoyladenosine biosynthesis protein TsaB
MILCLRADGPEVYVGIWNRSDELTGRQWLAGRELSVQLLEEIKQQCDSIKLEMNALEAVISYEGPGSYTGLRISVSVANTIGFSLSVPIVGVTGENWIQKGIEKLANKPVFVPVVPVYGGEVHTTIPKK